jgi:membrane protein
MCDPPSLAQRLRFVLIGALKAWINQRIASKGAALAFYTLFSLTPVLVLVIAIAGFFFGAQAAQGEIFAQLEGLVGPGGAQAIQMLLAGASNPEAGRLAAIIATILLLVGATSVFAELKDSLDEMWQMQNACPTGLVAIIRTRLLAFGLVLVLAFLLLVSLVINAGLAVLERAWGGPWADFSALLAPLASLISFGVIACLFAVIYKMLPEAQLSWRDVWIGALGTAALFSFGKYAIGAYLGHSGVASSFGAAGSVVALLLWVYYSAQIFFLGAEFTRLYALWFGSLHRSPAFALDASSPGLLSPR